MIIDQLRDVVHVQTQTTSGDLADSAIDIYLQQAFERTINADTQWPFYEQSWDLVLTAGQSEMAIPGDVNQSGVMALYDVANNFRLTMIGHEYGDDHFAGAQTATTAPVMYSIWGATIVLWPHPLSSVDCSYRLRGYRRPLVWLDPATNEPDCDARLHLPLTHYAVALAYAQQEDEQLELSYMDRWQRDVEMARRSIMEPRHQRPLVMAGSIDGGVSYVAAWTLVPPTP